MKKRVHGVFPVFLFLLLALAGCVNTGGGSAHNSAGTLTHGFAQGGGAGAAGAQSAADAARVVSVKPGVVSIFGGRADQLRPGMSVPLRAIVRSDATGKAQLALPDGSTVNVAPDSEIALADFADVPAQESGASGFTKGVARLLSGKGSTGAASQTSIGVRGLASRPR